MSSIDDLVAYRQQSLDLFVANGLKRNSHQRHSVITPFVRDAGLLTHPLYSLSIVTSSERHDRDLETNISQHLGSNLLIDSLEIANPSSYAARDNKYGVSSIEFDREGALFAVGGSNGVIRVYDFDEMYYHMRTSASASRSVESSETTSIQPIVRFDTRRDISCLCWSHLRPDDIAVGFLFRPEVHIFDLGDIGETAGLGEEVPTRVLEADSKGRSGHNVLLFWHTVKWEGTSSNNNRVATSIHSHNQNKTSSTTQYKRETEGLIGGSVSGHLRYWATSSSATTRTTSRNFLWQVLADPHRTAHTASAVVALLPIHSSSHLSKHLSNHSSKHSSPAVTLLLAATAQGVLTLWDLSQLRPANFGSTLPEPQCLRRIDYTTLLMLFEKVTLIGVCSTTPRRGCDSCCDTGKECTDNVMHSTVYTSVVSKQSNIQVITNSTETKTTMKNTTYKPSTTIASAVRSSEMLLLTLSTGDIYITDINTETLQRCHTGGQHTDTSTTTYISATLYPTTTKDTGSRGIGDIKAPVRRNANQLSEGLRYEELRQELALRSSSGSSGTSIGGGSALSQVPHRTVLPAVIPAWNSNIGHLHRQQTTTTTSPHTTQSALLQSLSVKNQHNTEPLPSLVTVVAQPAAHSSGTTIMAVDISPLPSPIVYPCMHDQRGAISAVSGKTQDPWTGLQTSNMRRVAAPATTLPGTILNTEPGSHEITTTHDLQVYLCSDAAVGTSFSKSHEIIFDWSYTHSLGEQTPLDGKILDENGLPYQQLSSTNTVTHISAHSIVLQRPYIGPIVSGGQPVVRIRTSLLPGGRTANSSTAAVAAGGGYSSKHKQQLSATHCTEAQYTALCAHPYFPCLVGGTQKDEVKIFNPTASAVLCEEEQREISGECLREDHSALSLEREELKRIQSTRRSGGHVLGRALPRREGEGGACIEGCDAVDTDPETVELAVAEDCGSLDEFAAPDDPFTTTTATTSGGSILQQQVKKRPHSEIEELSPSPEYTLSFAGADTAVGENGALSGSAHSDDPTVAAVATTVLQCSDGASLLPSASTVPLTTAPVTLPPPPTTAAVSLVLPLPSAAALSLQPRRNTLSSLLHAKENTRPPPLHTTSTTTATTTTTSTAPSTMPTGLTNKIHNISTCNTKMQNNTIISNVAAQKFKIQSTTAPIAHKLNTSTAPKQSAPSKGKLSEKIANTSSKTTNILQFFTSTKR